MSTIVNLRGTSGSGKSTVVHTLLRMYNAGIVEEFGARGDRPLVYQLILSPRLPPLFVFGPYRTQCGGCDAIQGYQHVLPPLIEKYARDGNILFEGLLISGGYGSVGRALGTQKATGHRVVFALLDTPLALSLERIAARRAAKGNFEPLNPKNTAQKYRAAHMSQKKIAEEFGHECVMIDHKEPVREVLALFGVNIPREPKYAKA